MYACSSFDRVRIEFMYWQVQFKGITIEAVMTTHWPRCKVEVFKLSGHFDCNIFTTFTDEELAVCKHGGMVMLKVTNREMPFGFKIVPLGLTEKALFKLRRGMWQISAQKFFHEFNDHHKHVEWDLNISVVCLDVSDRDIIVETVQAFNHLTAQRDSDGVLSSTMNLETEELELFYTLGKSFQKPAKKRKVSPLPDTPPRNAPSTPLYCMAAWNRTKPSTAERKSWLTDDDAPLSSSSSQ